MRALSYFLHNPASPRSGAHRRCLQMLRGLREAGYEVTLASSTLHSETPWSQKSIDHLKTEGIARVEVFHRSFWDCKLDGLEHRVRRLCGNQRSGLAATFPCPLSLTLWFRRLVDRLSPDLLLMNYCWFDQLMPTRLAPRQVIDTHDIVSVNTALRERVTALLEKHSRGDSDAELFDEHFMDRFPLEPDPAELAVYERYDDTIAISPCEATLLERSLTSSRVRLVGVRD